LDLGLSSEDNPKIGIGEPGREGANYTRNFQPVERKILVKRQIIFGFYENCDTSILS
jgi:hypothetical protein